METVHPEIDRYLAGWASPPDPILNEMEELAKASGFPIVGPQVGRLLEVLARAVSARRVFELGSGFGYSAYWFLRGMDPRGTVVLTDASRERAEQARVFLERGGFEGRFRIEIGDALELLSREAGVFDMVFNDVDKHDYPRVFDLASIALRPGGLLVSDNMLWHGEVLEKSKASTEARAVQELTRRLFESREFAPALLPIRDGVAVAVKIA